MLKNRIGFAAGTAALGITAANLLGAALSFADDATAAPVATADPSATPEPTGLFGCLGGIPTWVLIIVYVVILGAMFFFLIIRPQQKRKKEEAEMKNTITLGRQVVTIGGIVGTIVNIKDDNITIQTSLDNSLVEVKNWAIREIVKEATDEQKK